MIKKSVFLRTKGAGHYVAVPPLSLGVIRGFRIL